MDKLKDIGVRALKTAVQAFIGVVGINATGLTSIGTLKVAALAAAAAAVSVIQNALLAWATS